MFSFKQSAVALTNLSFSLPPCLSLSFSLLCGSLICGVVQRHLQCTLQLEGNNLQNECLFGEKGVPKWEDVLDYFLFWSIRPSTDFSKTSLGRWHSFGPPVMCLPPCLRSMVSQSGRWLYLNSLWSSKSSFSRSHQKSPLVARIAYSGNLILMSTSKPSMRCM